MNFSRIKTRAEIILYGHILNWPWRSHLERRDARGAVTEKAVSRYLERYAPFIADIREDITEKEASGQERIFSIWLQGEKNAPGIVQASLKSIRHNCTQELVVLDEKSIAEWISLPGYIMDKWKSGKIRPAHFADICRVELLYRYGGVWLDATCFVTSPIPRWITDEDFFIYLGGNTLKGSYAFVQNCFFRSRKGDLLVKVWREAISAYWAAENSAIDYFVHQLLFKMAVLNNPQAKGRFDRMPHMEQDPTHALWLEYRDRPFDRETYDRVTAGAFFQKTEYKSGSAKQPATGSFSDIMQKMYK